MNLLHKVESGRAAPTSTQPCTIFGYKDFCGPTVLGMPESVGMNGQMTGKHSRYHIWSEAWQRRGAQRLEELSEHGQARASQHWSPDGKRSGKRKRPTFHPPRARTICVQPDKYWHCFEGNLGETAERRCRVHKGLSKRYDAILSWNWNDHNVVISFPHYMTAHCCFSSGYSPLYRSLRHWERPLCLCAVMGWSGRLCQPAQLQATDPTSGACFALLR